MTDGTENVKNASSFESDSFATFEKREVPSIVSREPLSQPSSVSPADSDSALTDSAKPENPLDAGASVGNTASTESGASSFGDGSFASFEAKKPPVQKPTPSTSGYVRPVSQEPYVPNETVTKPHSGVLDVLGWITFIASFPVSFVALVVCAIALIVGGEAALLVIPILLLTPVGSIVVGILLNRRKDGKNSGTKNIIVGAVVSFFLLTMLLSSVGSKGLIPDNSDGSDEREEAMIAELFDKAARVSDVDFSSSEYAYIYDATTYGDNYKMLEADGFEHGGEIYEKIKINPNFLSVMPNELLGLLQEYDRAGSWDFYLIYNLDTEQYNCYPETAGEYNMLSIFGEYYPETGDIYVQINEYKLTYVKAAVSDF